MVLVVKPLLILLRVSEQRHLGQKSIRSPWFAPFNLDPFQLYFYFSNPSKQKKPPELCVVSFLSFMQHRTFVFECLIPSVHSTPDIRICIENTLWNEFLLHGAYSQHRCLPFNRKWLAPRCEYGHDYHPKRAEKRLLWLVRGSPP